LIPVPLRKGVGKGQIERKTIRRYDHWSKKQARDSAKKAI